MFRFKFIHQLVPLLLVLMASCATHPHIMQVGKLEKPLTFGDNIFDVEVTHVKSGLWWTNIWMDVRIHSKSAEEKLFDPSDMEIFSPALGLNFKHTQRQADGWQSHKPHAGMRDIPDGKQEWMLPTKIFPGTTVQASLMFETQVGQVEEIRTFELLFHGQKLVFEELQPTPGFTL